MKLNKIHEATTDTVVVEVGSDPTEIWDGRDSDGNLKPEFRSDHDRDWFITGDDEPEQTEYNSIESKVKRHEETLQKHSMLLNRIDSKLDNVINVVSRLGNR